MNNFLQAHISVQFLQKKFSDSQVGQTYAISNFFQNPESF